MDNMEFIRIAQAELSWRYKRDFGIELPAENIYAVWITKVLQNNKGLFSTPVSGDGVYWEVTYNGDKNELYIDTYKKQRNECVKNMSKEELTPFSGDIIDYIVYND